MVASGGLTVPSTELNSVKTYNLTSVGKALPAWVGAKRKALLNKKRKKDGDDRLEVIQELYFPTASSRVKVRNAQLRSRFLTSLSSLFI